MNRKKKENKRWTYSAGMSLCPKNCKYFSSDAFIDSFLFKKTVKCLADKCPKGYLIVKSVTPPEITKRVMCPFCEIV